MSLIYLYSYVLPVALSETNHRAPNFNRPMQNYATLIYKNNNNLVDFVVRNNDRKPVKLVDCILDVIISNVETGDTVLEKRAQITDEVKGRAQLSITSSETENWPLGGYAYNVKITRPGRNQELLYVDIASHTRGDMQLLPSVGQELIPAQHVPASEFTPISLNWDTYEDAFTTGAYPAENQVGSNTGFFTVAVYSTLWQGWFKTQISLENLAPTEKSWVDVELVPRTVTLEYNGTTIAPRVYNFVVNARWIRFVYRNHMDNHGSFDKVVYKIT
jgi:hypothetical protein